MPVCWGDMLKVTILKRLLRSSWFKSRAEEPDSQAGVASGWGQGMLWYLVLRKKGSDEGGWEQVRGFSERGVLERQRGDSWQLWEEQADSRTSLSFVCPVILSLRR